MRTNRHGTAVPVRGRVVERDRHALSGKIRRVKEKAVTHNADGERVRYFVPWGFLLSTIAPLSFYSADCNVCRLMLDATLV